MGPVLKPHGYLDMVVDFVPQRWNCQGRQAVVGDGLDRDWQRTKARRPVEAGVCAVRV
jgi:hypothetical protein